MPANRKAQIERINQVSAMARTSWIALLGYLAFIGVTLLGVEDADFFVPSRQTQLPLVNVAIPTASFFIFAPILAAALYIYLHIILLKLWDAIADANTPRIDGHPLGDHLNPWLVNDWALTRKGPPYTPARPLLALGNAASFLLVWAAGPLVLAGFWWRSMPAHNEWLTLLLAACLLLSLHAGLTSWRTARAWLARPRREPPSRLWYRSLPALALILVTTILTWLRTEGGTDHLAGRLIYFGERLSGRPASLLDEEQEDWIDERSWIPKLDWFEVTADTPILGRWIWLRWNPLARADLYGVAIVDLPEGWRSSLANWQDYRETWCHREGLDIAMCWQPSDPNDPPAQVKAVRSDWCEKHGIAPGSACVYAFADLDARFRSDWQHELYWRFRDVARLDLSGRDLRGANASNAILLRANLEGARLQGAFLGGAQLLSADLSNARLQGAYLAGAQLDGAMVGNARLEGADLGGAWLRQATIVGARLAGANLRGAHLDEATAHFAQLEGADLTKARLVGAKLIDATLDGATLWSADFKRSDWSFASTQASPVHYSDLRGVTGLTQAQLDNLVGNADTLLPLTPESVPPLFVWSCWELPPDGFVKHVERASLSLEFGDREAIRAELICGADNPRRKTGTPLPLDAPYPEGHPLADR